MDSMRLAYFKGLFQRLVQGILVGESMVMERGDEALFPEVE